MEKGSILLIEDDVDMLIIGEKIIETAGYHFISARTGKEGLERLKSQNPDLVLLDYVMPDMDGKQFLEIVFQDKAWQQIPIIIITARTIRSEEIDHLFRMGLRAYLIKPFGYRELINVIDNILRISKQQREQPQGSGFKEFDVLARELKGSVNSILGLAKMLLSNGNGTITEEQRLALMAIYNSSRNMLKLLQDKML